MRANFVIDDDLIKEVMELTGCKTERETVEEALKLLARIKRQEKIRAAHGKLHWQSDQGESYQEKMQRNRVKKFRELMDRLSYVSTGGRKFTRDEMNER